MDFRYSEEQSAIAQAGAAVFEGHATPERVATLEAGEPNVDRELWAELASAQLLGVLVPEEYGGLGLSVLELAPLLIEHGRRVAPVPVLSCAVAAGALARFAGEAASRLLPAVTGGNSIVTVAWTTPGAGDPFSPSVRAQLSGPAGTGSAQEWVLSGEAPMVAAATVADAVLVPAKVDGGGTRVFVIGLPAAGVQVTRAVSTDRQERGHLLLDDVKCSAADLLEEGALEWIVDHARVGLCALQVGVTSKAVSLAAQYASNRVQFGKPLASFQGVALRAADAHIDVAAIEATMWQAAWQVSRGRDAHGDICVAKWWAAEAGHRVVHAVQHLHGGLGADVTYPVHRYFLWGKQIEVELGAGAWQLDALGSRVVA